MQIEELREVVSALSKLGIRLSHPIPTGSGYKWRFVGVLEYDEHGDLWTTSHPMPNLPDYVIPLSPTLPTSEVLCQTQISA